MCSSDLALFVGRDEILRQLEELWLNPGQVDSLVLYGHRRMGKSSILKNLSRRLDPARNWIVDFNLQTVNRANTGSLLYDLALAMRDQLPADQVQSHPAPSEDSFRDNFQRTFNQWLASLDPLMDNRRFIVAIDEYELLEAPMAPGQVDRELIPFLRGVIQTRPWFVLDRKSTRLNSPVTL